MDWAQYQQMFEKKHKAIDKLVDKLCKNIHHPKAKEWERIILDSGLYDESDLMYMRVFKDRPNDP